MSWLRIDDRAHSHIKFLRAGHEATGFWMMCGSYAADHELNGEVPREFAERLAGSPQALRRLSSKLIAVGLWEVSETGWRMHDYLAWNPSREELERKRVDASAKGRKGAGARWGSRDATGIAAGNATGIAASNAACMPPSRPDPTSPREREKDLPSGDVKTPTAKSASSAKRGERLPENWQASPELLAKLRSKFKVDAAAAVDRFKNHWLAASGRNATKLDWNRAFENWVDEDTSRGKLPVWIAPRPRLAKVADVGFALDGEKLIDARAQITELENKISAGVLR